MSSEQSGHGEVVGTVQSRILVGTMGLVAAQALTSAAGYFYWLAAAHAYGAREIGLSASVTSLSIVISLVCGQAFVASALVRLPRCANQRGVILGGSALGGSAAAVLGMVAVTVIPVVIPPLALVRHAVVAIAVVVICTSQTVGAFCDGAAIATGQVKVLVWRNGVFGVGKLALTGLLIVVGERNGPDVLLGAWAITGALTSGAALWWLARATRGSRWELHVLRGGLGPQAVASVAGSVPPQLLPALVVAQVGTTMGGYFSLTWLLGGLCFSISPAVCQAMLPTDRKRLGSATRFAVRLIALSLLVPVLLFVFFARPVLDVFGAGYGRYGAGLLLVLGLSALPDAATNIAVARWRIEERLRLAALMNGVIAAVALGLATTVFAAGRSGLVGIGYAWLCGELVGCGLWMLIARSRSPARGRVGFGGLFGRAP